MKESFARTGEAIQKSVYLNNESFNSIQCFRVTRLKIMLCISFYNQVSYVGNIWSIVQIVIYRNDSPSQE